MTNELKSESLTPNVPQKEKRQGKKQEMQEKQDKKEKQERPIRWYNFRLIPIWLRILLVVLFITIAGASGLMIGFGVIGGGNPTDILKWETWEHILNMINGIE